MADMSRSGTELEGTVLLEYSPANNPVYIGEAGIGVQSSEAQFRIRKLTYDAFNNVTSILWASGNARYDKVWDLRATYAYS